MLTTVTDKRAPMASAPMKYLLDGSVDWGNMWDSFCVLAQEGGPPHRESMLYPPANPDPESPGYRFAAIEIIRGIQAVSELRAEAIRPGWITLYCPSAAMAHWLAEAICQENVQACAEDTLLLLPVSDKYTLKGEIKNVITAVAKTTHYWQEHVPSEVKNALAWQARIELLKQWIFSWRLR